MIDEAVRRPFTVVGYQNMFASIYTEANKKYSDPELLLRLLEEVSVVMEIVRKDKREDLPEQLARTYAWVNGLANRLQIQLQEVLWNKFPNVCSYCMRAENCSCAVEHPTIQNKETILRRLRRDRSKEPKSLKEHQELHGKLYGRQNDRLIVIQVAAHLAEEAGEISRDFRHHDMEKLGGEMSDVLSWIFALANRLHIDLEKTVWEQYPHECEKCQKIVCVCENDDPPKHERRGTMAV